MLAHIRNLLSRLGYALLFFALARLVFFLFNAGTYARFGFFKVIGTFFYGLLFDVSAIAYVNLLFFLLCIIPVYQRAHGLYQMVLRVIFVVTNGVALLLNLIDVEYIKFSGKRSGLELLQTDNEIGNLLGQYISDYWYLLLIFFALVTAMWRFYPKGYAVTPQKYTVKQYVQQGGLFLLSAACWVLAARGGFYLKPIRPFDAGRFVQAELIPLTLNTPFQFISTVGNKPVPVPAYFDSNQSEKIYPVYRKYPSQAFQKKNVVILILESFGKEYVGYCNGDSRFTPFLDSLSGYSTVFTNAYASGKKSIEALPAILSALPSLLETPFINSPYQSNALTGIGKLLKQEGYTTAFYHGAKNGTMGFDGFVGVSSFGIYYGLNEYPGDVSKDKTGPWGIDDGPYLRYVNTQLTNTTEPFCAAVFTLSSHHPYAIPEAYRFLPRGTLDIHQSIAYTDASLREFFAQASRLPWYKHTVFFITADHSAQNAQPFYQTMAGKFAVPALLFDPSAPIQKKVAATFSHCDIEPTLLQYLGYNHSFPAFGVSALSDSVPHFAVQYENGLYQYISENMVLHFDGSKINAVYNMQTDSLLRNNLISQWPANEKLQAEQQLKAYIQNYYQRLNANTLLKK
ncbi:MAG: sulfatase-like hydrolase/transferase [Bacteroidia bacterium]|nr:sulfatase-like hydrolase/transferase [Bacteroidia bacterium]